MGIFGVVLTISNGDIKMLLNLKFNIGDIIMLLAALCLAIYSVAVKPITNKFSPLIITKYTLLISTIILIPFSIKPNTIKELLSLSLMGWLSVIYMAIFPTVIAYIFQQIAIKKIGASQTEMFRNLVPVFSIILSFVFLKEKINYLNMLSMIIITSSVYINSRFNES